jgi:hypothetical protein
VTIAYLAPLGRAWERMKKDLFRPFDPGKWIVVGFTAFLAGLASSGFPRFSGTKSTGPGGSINSRQLFDFPELAIQWMRDNPGWFIIILVCLLLLIALGIFLTWVSSRGMFMFLDNVVNNRAKVTGPWRRYKALGNSLFFWRICFSLICLVAMFFVIAIIFSGFAFGNGNDIFDPFFIIQIVCSGLLFLAIVLIAGYISLFTYSFVVPIMYKYDLTILHAWNRFIALFRLQTVSFLLYGLFVLLLYVVTALAVFLAGCFTCCIGFLLLIIPYLSSVILLPVIYTYRCFSLEFLGQFGTEFSLLEDAAPTATSQELPEGTEY